MSTFITGITGFTSGFSQQTDFDDFDTDEEPELTGEFTIPSQDSVSVLPMPRSPLMPEPFFRYHPRILQIQSNADRTEVQKDSTGNYVVSRTIHNIPVGYPRTFSFEEFKAEHKRHVKRDNFIRFIEEAELQRESRRGLLDFRITIPGGQRSAFTTIFGRPEVNLRVTGSANMNIGVSISETEDPALPADQRKRVDPKFDQNLKLNISGTIGDKLTISTDWDTERAFEYENRLNILYTGYEDEIIQSIELGNVSMETGNSLIRGGGALFGIKAKARLGALEVTTVISQQEGDSQTETISGGSQEQIISVAPNAYEDDRHFFLDFYTLQEYERLMSDPFYSGRILEIINIDVYVQKITSTVEEGQRNVLALLDYGSVLSGDTYERPNEDLDPFDPGFLEQFRDPTVGVSSDDLGVSSDEYEVGEFIPLRRGIDYQVNESLGFISLRTRLDQRQALAVSYSYRDLAGNIVYVGDPNQGDNQRLFMKLLRPSNTSPSSRAWPLTMRNIYSLNTTNLTRDNLELDIFYTGGTVDQVNIPGLNNILLQSLGLDRVDQQGNTQPNNEIDFNTPTLDPVNGRIIFPYLQPFGQRIIDVINASNLSPDAKDDAINRYAFTELYTSRANNAGQSSKNAIYRISGATRGGVSDTYFLGIALVPGSVRVTANGIELTENVDYQVDYVLGNIVITNRQYLSAGQDIEVEFESNQILQIQQTTFTGVRAQYNFNDNISIGSTYFRLKERPIQDKIPIGDEPINNTIIGFDGRARFDAPWLTRAINAVPLLSTRAPSSFDITGEWAQLRPGVSQTNAVQRAIDRGELFEDEERGLAFIDDFEGSKSTISFLNPGRWSLAAAPYALPGYDSDLSNASQANNLRIDRSDRRAQFSWYMIPSTEDRGAIQFPESAFIRITDVFPNRQLRTQDQNILQTLDIYYNPRERGPYNYNMDLREFLENRQDEMWGGMTAVLPGGLGDFTQQNIEFLEFWVQPVLPDGRQPTSADIANYDGKIIFDIGTVSEDVIPNNTLNTEDGLAERENNLRIDSEGRSYVLNTPVEFDGQFSVANIAREDVGLDGVPSTGNNGINEQTLFADFIAAMEVAYADQPDRVEQIRNDPSNDEYIFYRNNLVRNLPLHERFYRMYGYLEGNSISEGSQQAITSRPDTEGLINPAVVNTEDAFFQYEFRMNPADTTSLRVGENYIVDVQTEANPDLPWYQVRIPIRDFVRQVGSIEDLQRVTHIRMWMTGYKEPFTLRFATMEFVGNLWRKAENVGNLENPNTTFDVSTINIEENASRQPVPYRVPPGAIRSRIRGQQEQVADNEQSIVLSVQNLRSQDVRMISRIYPGNLSLVNYSNLRMFVHGEGYSERGDVEVVIRLGNNLENSYYEFRQPITPTDTTYVFGPNSESLNENYQRDIEEIWKPDENSVNLVLSVLNELKQLRNFEGADVDTKYERSDILRDAAPGATVAILGNPSLDRITEIGLGVRNPHGGRREVDPTIDGYSARMLDENGSQGVPNLNAELWLNELRVSGFDNQRAWSGNVSARIQMADFATFNARFSHTQDGFGSLNSRMIDRRKSDETNYDLSTNISLHRFIPERYGWSLPLSLSTRSSISTPRFLPQEGDIRFDEFRTAIENEVEDPAERDRIIDERLREIQTRSDSYTINLNNWTKNNSRSFLGRYLLDPLTLGYNYTTSTASNPNNAYDDRWNYRASLAYSLTFRNIDTVRPLWFMENVPVLNVLSGLRFAYLPTSISTTQTIDRRYGETQRRSFGDQEPFQLQQTHQFAYVNTFSVNYDIMPPISLRFNNRSEFDLDPLSRSAFNADSTVYNLRSSFDVLNDAFFNPEIEMRHEFYSEDYSGSWRPRFQNIAPLSWLNYTFNYRGGFSWRNSPADRNLGATVSNQYSLDNTLNVRFQDLIRKVPFYDNFVKSLEDERRQRETRQRQRSEQREREREQRRIERERERAEARGEEYVEEPQQRQGQVRRMGQNQQQNDSQEIERYTIAENISFFARSLLAATVSMQTFDITYGNSRTSSQSGYAGGASFFSQFNDPTTDDNFSPTFLFRTGLDNRIPFAQLVQPEDENEIISLSKQENINNDMRIRTRITPFRDFSVDLDWNIRWRDNVQNSITVFPDSLNTQFTQSGEIETSVWAFGAGYSSFFRRQLQTAFNDLPNEGSEIIDSGDGDMVLSPNTIQSQFRASYLAGVGSTVDGKSYMPFPMPTWRVTWGGWERRIPFVRNYIQRMSFSHNYTSTYRLQWRFFPDEGNEVTRRIGDFTSVDFRNEFEPNNITLTRSFSPLVGLNLTFNNGLRTTANYNRTNTTSFSISNSNVLEQTSQSVSLQFGYSVRGFRLPFFRRFSNTLDLNLNLNYAEDVRLTYLLNNDLGEVLRGDPSEINRDVSQYQPGEPSERGDARITITPSIGYTFSDTIRMNFEYSYRQLIPRSSNVFARVDQDIVFNIVITIRS